MRIGSVIFGERFKPESARLLRCSRCAWAAGEVQTLHEMLAETEQEAASLRAATATMKPGVES